MKLHRILTFGVIAVATFVANAQNTYSGYFFDNNLYRNTLNPAFGNEDAFFSFPGLGNLNFGLRGNLNLKDVLYNVDGHTTTFMNPSLSASDVLKNFSSNNTIGADMNMNILTVGFKAFKGYNTISINARANVNASIPYEVFEFLKEGVTNKDYDISDIHARAQGYAEIALGHSHKINKNLTIGAKVKVLVGAGNVQANLDKAHLTLGSDKWTVVTNATVHSSLVGLKYKTELNDNTGNMYVNGVDVEDPGVGGLGFAFDLGAVYNFKEDWQFSASLLDVGFISWKNDMVASTNGDHTFNTNDYVFNPDGNADNKFSNEWDNMRDRLCTLYELKDMGDAGKRTTMLAATLNVGAQYTLPVYRKVKFGLLNTTRFAGIFTTTDFRLSANYLPCKYVGLGANVAAGSYGVDCGWMLNFMPPGFNLFIGMDRMFAKVAKQGVPLSSKAALNFGMNFHF